MPLRQLGWPIRHAGDGSRPPRQRCTILCWTSADRWPLDQRVDIVPGMRGSRPLAQSLGRNGRMMMGIPAVVVTGILRRQINAAQKCRSVHPRRRISDEAPV